MHLVFCALVRLNNIGTCVSHLTLTKIYFINPVGNMFCSTAPVFDNRVQKTVNLNQRLLKIQNRLALYSN